MFTEKQIFYLPKASVHPKFTTATATTRTITTTTSTTTRTTTTITTNIYFITKFFF